MSRSVIYTSPTLLVTDQRSACKAVSIGKLLQTTNEIHAIDSATRHLQALPYVMTCKDKLFMNIN